MKNWLLEIDIMLGTQHIMYYSAWNNQYLEVGDRAQVGPQSLQDPTLKLFVLKYIIIFKRQTWTFKH